MEQQTRTLQTAVASSTSGCISQRGGADLPNRVTRSYVTRPFHSHFPFVSRSTKFRTTDHSSKKDDGFVNQTGMDWEGIDWSSVETDNNTY